MKCCKGFTLVELLVVIGITSVLIAILLPALNKVRQQAKTVQCASNMRQVMMGLMMYAQDYKGQLPRGSYVDPNYKDGNGKDVTITWAALIGSNSFRYINDPRTFFCPSRFGLDKAYSDLTTWHSITTKSWDYISYGANWYGAMPSATSPELHPIKLAQPGVQASEFLILSEVTHPSVAKSYYGWYLIHPATIAGSGMTPTPLFRHEGDVANCAYLDGHVASVPAKQLGWDTANDQWMSPNWTYFVSKAPWYLKTFTTN